MLSIVTLSQLRTMQKHLPYPEDREYAQKAIAAKERRNALFNNDCQEVSLEMERIPESSIPRMMRFAAMLHDDGTPKEEYL